MKKRVVIAVFLFLISVGVVVAIKPDFANSNSDSNSKVFSLPENAVEISPGVFSLGKAFDRPSGRIVEGYAFVHNKRGNAKPPWAGQGNGGGEKCYSEFAKGAKWKKTEQYITGSGIDSTLTEISLSEWDSEVSFDIFGTRDVSGTTDGADTVSPDGKNEVEFANLGSTNTIAFTIVWGIFGGPPKGRVLVEWDAVFNSDYPWSLNGEAGKMDYQNIATHEFGHSLGLGHPSDSCTEETMYAFADFGETKKSTLESGDIGGVQKLYA